MAQNPRPLTANVSRSQSDQLVTHWYGWFFVVSSLFWPRICLLGFWIFGSFMADAFNHSWVLQVAGFLILPWTTMVYALMWGLTSTASLAGSGSASAPRCCSTSSPGARVAASSAAWAGASVPGRRPRHAQRTS